jgi:hypothetical protein
MDNSSVLEKKIDDLVTKIGGLDRLRDLSRLASLDHLVNLHLLSHLTKLDKIEGLKELEKLKSLDSLSHLHQLDKLENLNLLRVVDEIKNLEKLDKLDSLKDLRTLDRLDELKKLQDLDKLSSLEELKNLTKLESLDNLKELERLNHLSYLKNLDRLQELNLLSKLDQLQDLKLFMDQNKDIFPKFKHLEALDNLALLGKLSELDKLDRLDELKRLDKLEYISNPAFAPPALPGEGEEPKVQVVSVPYRKSFLTYSFDFILDLLRSLVLAALIIVALQYPQGRKTAQQAVNYLGFGEGLQVNWALETLWSSPTGSFDKHWNDFLKKLDVDINLTLELSSGLGLKRRYENLNQLFVYEFDYEAEKLDVIVRKKVRSKITLVESVWTDDINAEIGQLMLKQGDSRQLGLWNQLKELTVGGRWQDLLKVSLAAPQDEFAQEAAIIALTHLKLNDSTELKQFFVE